MTIDSPSRPLPLPLALETANDRNRGAKERERALNNNKPVPRILRASTRAPSRATGTNAFGAGARVGTAGAAVGGRRATRPHKSKECAHAGRPRHRLLRELAKEKQ